MLGPWLAVGAGLGALAVLPDQDPTAPAAALSPLTTVSEAAPAVTDFASSLATAPAMALPAPPPGPSIRLAFGPPSLTGLLGVADASLPDPRTLSGPARIDRLFAVAGEPTRELPEGYTHPLLTPDVPKVIGQQLLLDTSPDPEDRFPERTPQQWAELRWCESSGNYGATNFSGKYRGAYQFDQATWESVGGTGDPAQADPAEQDRLAKELYATRGSAPWPYCGRYLQD